MHLNYLPVSGHIANARHLMTSKRYLNFRPGDDMQDIEINDVTFAMRFLRVLHILNKIMNNNNCALSVLQR